MNNFMNLFKYYNLKEKKKHSRGITKGKRNRTCELVYRTEFTLEGRWRLGGEEGHIV